MSCIVFETKGEIDLRAFTLMGATAKPNTTNPIGMFGTGLKYSVATLVRLGGTFIVHIGEDKYTFFKRPDTFRGGAIEKLSMRRESFKLTKSRITDLPFVLTYGRNWQAWMCFRELMSNTIDEGGRCWHDTAPAEMLIGQPGLTRIVIDHPDFEKAFWERDTIFLPNADRQGSGVQVVDKQAQALYWRGLKVLGLQKPSMFTYNFLEHMRLTEDRTLEGGDYWARNLLAEKVVRSDDEEFITEVLEAEEDFWEHDLPLDKDIEPSEAFHRVMGRSPRVSQRTWGYYSSHDPRIRDDNFQLFEKHPAPWRLEGDAIVDNDHKTIFTKPYNYEGKWNLAALGALLRLNPKETSDDNASEAEAAGSGRADSDGSQDRG